MLYDQHDTVIKHLTLAGSILEELAKQDDALRFVHEKVESALVGVLLSRQYQYDFAPLTDAMRAWR